MPYGKRRGSARRTSCRITGCAGVGRTGTVPVSFEEVFHHTYRKFKQPLFSDRLYRQPGELSIVFLVDENRGFASVGSGDVSVGRGLESAFQTAKQKQVGAIMTLAGGRFLAERKRIVEFAVKYRLPAIYFQKEFVDEGGLMSYGVKLEDQFPQGGSLRRQNLERRQASRPAGGAANQVRAGD